MNWLNISTENCPIQRTLDIVGEKWTLLLLRDAVNGVRRFEDFHRHIGLSESVLTDRLRKLVTAGILKVTPYQEPGSRARNEYRLTSKGWDLWPVLMALRQWGDQHAADPEGPVLDVRHAECGAPVRAVVTCGDERVPLGPAEVTVLPGPSARPRP
ncbi:helix-turn-helix transcriptional regulator [Streptomyces samsunensis]|uniref:HTH hxlR-type domain-containing protein n=2 Tax=Streptomyces malaysiensis TaxID=92644 RepID=A0A2J7Z699_STRMQ|nr:MULTISPECIES: helix-turn-helix domain-containing protein [Streptomyces]MCC4316123.1 helix-turn-helix transcriptional regulator [Streptomyces malaysiensis]MCD9588122.1 helix-turn-helix transcriptional regulator [Streptomyces sp. 8ZJF_21]MCM3804996.1 helix-turn-helix transcriptional regulator [Streptomyces sp. DR7-3]MCQ8828815.1 helix-turn-helix transcriptional regulator [Streptomyces samsunensis]NUH35749.1 helix-turn-helix transcriptional regulator [Streptomyces samsunensis]